VEVLQDFFNSLSGWGGYIFIFLSSLGENLFPPVPGDTFVVLGAFLVGRGQLKFLPAYLSATVGGLLGFMIVYFVGFFWGRRFFEGKKRRIFSQENLEKVEIWFSKYGYFVIAGNRFLSGFRGVVSLGAGIVKMDAKKVAGVALFSCLVWNGFLMGMGIWVGKNWEVILHHYQCAVFVLISLAVFFWWIRSIILKRRVRR